MDDLPVAKLVELVAERGHSLAQDASLCQALLLDHLRGGYTKEAKVLSAAVRVRALSELLAGASNVPLKALCCRLANKLHDAEGIDKELALWAVEAWALALGLSLTVSAQGHGEYRSINDAIQAATVPMVMIKIRPGVYKETVLLDRPVIIIGDGNRVEIVISSADGPCLVSLAENATVRGLSIRGQAGTVGKSECAVDVRRGGLLLENCDVTANSLACLAIHGPAADPTIRHCTIRDNGEGHGIAVYSRAKGTIEHCEILSCKLYCVAVRDRANSTVRGCKIHGSRLRSGVAFYENGMGTLVDCEIFDNGGSGGGVLLSYGACAAVLHCEIHDNEFNGVSAGGVAQCVIEESDIHDNGFGVCANQANDLRIRQCRIHHNLLGLTMGDGMGTVEDCDIFGNTGPGVEVEADGDPIVRSCRIHDNVTQQEMTGAGGVFVYEGGRGTFDACDISANNFAGVVIYGNPIIRGCQITCNLGAGVVAHGGSGGAVEGCRLHGNEAGAWDIAPDSQVRRRDNQA